MAACLVQPQAEEGSGERVFTWGCKAFGPIAGNEFSSHHTLVEHVLDILFARVLFQPNG